MNHYYHPSKYNNVSVTYDGIRFDSMKEAARYKTLKLMERAGQISDIQLQVPFELTPTQRDENGNLLFRKRNYIADFVYMKDGEMIVEDVKGYKTDTYELKKALMYEKYKILIQEV